MNTVFKRVPDKQLAGTKWLSRRNLQHLQSIVCCGKHSRSAWEREVTAQIQLLSSPHCSLPTAPQKSISHSVKGQTEAAQLSGAKTPPSHRPETRRSRQNRFLKQQQARSRRHNPRQGGRAQFNIHHQKNKGRTPQRPERHKNGNGRYREEIKTPEHRDRMAEEQESPIMWKTSNFCRKWVHAAQPLLVPEHMQGCKNHG